MARRARLLFAGVPQHLIQRGNNRQATFFAEEAADPGAAAAAAESQGADIGIGVGVPFSAPWSCLFMGVAQSCFAAGLAVAPEAAGAGWA